MFAMHWTPQTDIFGIDPNAAAMILCGIAAPRDTTIARCACKYVCVYMRYVRERARSAFRVYVGVYESVCIEVYALFDPMDVWIMCLCIAILVKTT